MAYLIPVLTSFAYILQLTDGHLVRDIGPNYSEISDASLSPNLEDVSYNQGSIITGPIDMNFQREDVSFNAFAAVNEQHGLRIARSPKKKQSKRISCYSSVQNTPVYEYDNAVSAYWKTCSKISTTIHGKLGNHTTVVRTGHLEEYDTGCRTNEEDIADLDGYKRVIKTCYCNNDKCNSANSQAIFSSILLMAIPVLSLVTSMVLH